MTWQSRTTILRVIFAVLGVCPCARGQAEPVQTFFDHPDGRFGMSGQINTIFQYHPPFPAAYSGEHSLHDDAETATSVVMTVHAGARLFPSNELLVSVELAAGGGISTALGLAGFTNLDVVRNPSLGSNPYVARGCFTR